MVEKIVASILLVTISPVILLCAILILVIDRHPPFFVQVRQGLTRDFNIIKFRTMRTQNLSKDQQQKYEAYQKLKNDPRCTNFGRILRATSIDELPQLWNVAKGEMSFIGPRPCLPSQKKTYYGQTPGITGLTQARYRNKVRFRSRKHIEKFYAENQNLTLNTYIVLMTVTTLIKLNGK